MKKLKNIIILLLILLTAATSYTNFAYADNGDAEIVIELNSRRILHEKDIDKKMYPASTTKILTAICAIENCDINKSVTIGKNCVGIEGSSIYLEEGEILTVKDLLYGLMLRSGNDAATAIALNVSGSIEKFAELMNETATKAGATSSNFVNPHGLHDDNHYVTARDLAYITAYAMKNRVFREIVSTKKTEIPNTVKGYKRILVNKNKMIFEYDGACGVKTGYTKKAGRCLVSAAKRGNSEFICVVLSCPPMFEKSKQLFDDYFNNYVTHNLFESDNIIKFADTEKGGKVGLYIKEDILLPLTEKEFKELKIVIDAPEIIKSGTPKDTEIGLINIYCKNDLIFSQKLYTINGVK